MADEKPKHITLIGLLTVLRDYNIAAAELKGVPGREGYKAKGEVLHDLILLLGSESFAHSVITTEFVVDVYCQTIAKKEHFSTFESQE